MKKLWKIEAVTQFAYHAVKTLDLLELIGKINA